MTAIPSLSPGDADSLSAWKREFARAAAVAHPRELWLTVAGEPVRLTVAGEALAAILSNAFGHLVAPPRPEPALCIDLWDEAATGVARPEMLPANLWDLGGGRFSACEGNRIVGIELSASAAYLDRSASSVVGCVTAAELLSLHERGKPLQALFSIWHSDRDLQLVHAGLVAHEGRGALLPGPSGTGKSTCSLACARAGMTYLGDDCIAIDVRRDVSVGHSLYGSAYLDPSHARRFPELLPSLARARRPDELKALVIANAGRSVSSSVPISAIVLPRLGEGPARVRPATKREALILLAPSSILQMIPRQDVRGFERLTKLVERAPAYWLDMGPNLDEIPVRIAEILEGAKSQPSDRRRAAS